MKNKLFVYILIFIFSVFISSVSQIILKKSAVKTYKNKLREYLNFRVISAYFIFFSATIITIFSYRFIPLSVGAALEALGYLFVALLDRLILKTHINKKKCTGLFIIVSGVIIVVLGK